MNKKDCTIRVAKTKALISCADLHLCFRIGINPGFSYGAYLTILREIILNMNVIDAITM